MQNWGVINHESPNFLKLDLFQRYDFKKCLINKKMGFVL